MPPKRAREEDTAAAGEAAQASCDTVAYSGDAAGLAAAADGM